MREKKVVVNMHSKTRGVGIGSELDEKKFTAKEKTDLVSVAKKSRVTSGTGAGAAEKENQAKVSSHFVEFFVLWVCVIRTRSVS